MNLLINTWLKRQISLGKTWGRVYGKGFRDILQDTSSFVSLDTQMARVKIKLILSYQFENGNSIRQFDPIFDYPYQDGPSWIPATILAYLKETNDETILSEVVNYYNSSKKDTVFNHMKKGIDYLINNNDEKFMTWLIIMVLNRLPKKWDIHGWNVIIATIFL